MGLVAMSERELRRVETMAEIEDGALTPAQAAGVLNVSTRQVFRMLARYRTGGPVALAHGARGRPSNNRIPRGRKEYGVCSPGWLRGLRSGRGRGSMAG